MQGGVNPNDEFYTPQYAILPILKYLKPKSTVWCPFDTEQSNFVKLLKQNEFNVVFTHVEFGCDFFNTDVPVGHIDYIISNPPYSMKTEVFKRLFELIKSEDVLPKVGLA